MRERPKLRNKGKKRYRNTHGNYYRVVPHFKIRQLRQQKAKELLLKEEKK